jgi:K+:H+ antiporter
LPSAWVNRRLHYRTFHAGPPADVDTVQVLAEIGVALLMFALRAEFSWGELRRLGRVAGFGGSLQVVCTTGLWYYLPALGLPLLQGIFLGALLALSSTVVARIGPTARIGP